MTSVEEQIESGQIGGRTVQIASTGEVECVTYPLGPLSDGSVRIRTNVTAVSPGTEATFLGSQASNPYLNRRWNPDLRLFEDGQPTVHYPITLGYRAAGTVVESRSSHVHEGQRLWGNWRHTEYVTMPAEKAAAQHLPEPLEWSDGVDIAQMAPISLNAVAFAEGAHRGEPAVVFGAGPVGLITAQVVKAHASPVYVVDLLHSRLDLAKSLDLIPVNGGAGDVAAQLKSKHGYHGIPAVWECTGSTVALHEAIRTVKPQGLVIAVGFYQGEASGLALGEEFHHNGVKLVSGQIGNVHPSTSRQLLPMRTLELALAGELVLGGLPRTRFPVEEAADALEAQRRPEEVFQVEFVYE